MKHYIGVKLINAKSMIRADYNTMRGWKLPEDEHGEDKGFLVEYTDGGKSNVPGFEGYVSWSPYDAFQNAYREVHGLTFGLAIEALKKGLKVARVGWNGKGMWLKHVGQTTVADDKDDLSGYEGLPWIGMKTADNKFVPWLASQTDVLAEDWQIIE